MKPLKNGEFQLQHAAIAELSPEAIVDGAIMDSSLVVEAVSRLISENGVKSQNFGGSLSGHSV
ncbi:MAG: pilus assembly protein PilM, partial [Acidobacteriota bacterium]